MAGSTQVQVLQDRIPTLVNLQPSDQVNTGILFVENMNSFNNLSAKKVGFSMQYLGLFE